MTIMAMYILGEQGKDGTKEENQECVKFIIDTYDKKSSTEWKNNRELITNTRKCKEYPFGGR